MGKWGLASLVALALMITACGGGGTGSSDPAEPLSGNWLITLNRVANPTPLMYSGFLLQQGTSVTGSLIPGPILGDRCQGVFTVTGTLKRQDLELDVNELGQDLSLTGTLRSADTGSGSAAGQFSKVSGGCSFGSTGTWTAVQIPPLSGPFHGTIGLAGSTLINVTGTMTQGQNIGSSNATLTGTITLTPPYSQTFCSIPNPISINGLISGTTLSFQFYDQNGNPLSTVPEAGTVTPDGTSLTSMITLSAVQNTDCPISTAQGLQITFP